MLYKPVYPTIILYIDLDGDDIPETIISKDVNTPIEGQSGNSSYRDTDRIAGVGGISLSFFDTDGTYLTDPEYYIGRAIGITLTLGTREKQIGYGHVSYASIESSDTEKIANRITVTVKDWMDNAQKTRVRNITLASFVTADEAIPLLLSTMSTSPAFTDLDIGFERFQNVFDGALQSTVGYSELDKLIKSELGWLYLRFRDTTYGETLRFENYLSRGSTHPVTNIPIDVDVPFYMRKRGDASNLGYLKIRKNGVVGKLKLAQIQDAYIDRLMVDSDWEAGGNIINQMSVNNVPRRTDASDVVLYTITAPFQVGTTQIFPLDGTYSDPNGGTVIRAFDVSLTYADISFNSEEDGSGTDLRANLQTSFFPYVNGFRLILTNLGPAGYVTNLVIRGKGIYKYDQIETVRENVESQTELKSVYSDSITREYSSDYNVSRSFGDSVLAVNRKPINIMKSASFIANYNELLCLAFMYLEQGDKLTIVESNPPHVGDYYIQGVRYKIDTNGIIYFTWYLKEEIKTLCTPLTIKTSLSPNRNAIDFGVLPYLTNLSAYSYSAWVKIIGGQQFAILVGRSVDTGSGRRGNYLLLTAQKFYFISHKTPTDGQWQTTNNVLTTQNVWYHVVLTYDNSIDTADPVIYLNGTSVAITELVTPSGTTDDDSDIPLTLFNIGPNPSIFGQRYFYDTMQDVAMKDVRIYNHILTQAEVTALYNGQDDPNTVQDGLLFNGIYVPTDNFDDYANTSIENDDLVLDIVHGAAGVPYNEDNSNTANMMSGEGV